MPDTQPGSGRLLSLDIFRGATIAGMMVVNNPGDWGNTYAALEHANWNGWTFTDLIFPFFLWIVGVAMTLSFAKRVERGEDKKQLARHAVQRSAIIFLLGLFLAAFPFGLAFGHHFSLLTLRIPGVLQRIAVCYLVASFIFLYSGLRGQIIWTGSLLVVYWLLVKLVPVPGYGAGVMDPTGSLCWYIDSNLLAGHTWSGAPVPGFDPEGIVSTLPAIATTLFGALTGHLLRTKKSPEEKTALMFVAGNVLLFVGIVMNDFLPINKNMWTSSYSVFMAGMALNVFAFCYWVADVKGYKAWGKPFAIYGMNAITVFFLAGIFGKLLYMIKVGTTPEGHAITLKAVIYQNIFLPLASPINASLLYALAFMLFLYGVAYLMYRKKWIIKV